MSTFTTYISTGERGVQIGDGNTQHLRFEAGVTMYAIVMKNDVHPVDRDPMLPMYRPAAEVIGPFASMGAAEAWVTANRDTRWYEVVPMRIPT
mgnify:CR=1 FL=1